MGCGIAIGVLVLLGVIGALADGDKGDENRVGPKASTESASDDISAEGRRAFIANYNAVLTAAKPCDALAGALGAAAKSGSPLTLYQAAKAGHEACQASWQAIYKLEPADLPDVANEKEKAALKICSGTYFLRQRAMETAMEIADGDAKASKLSSFQNDMRDSQAGVLLCVAKYIEASEPAGVKIDQMKMEKE